MKPSNNPAIPSGPHVSSMRVQPTRSLNDVHEARASLKAHTGLDRPSSPQANCTCLEPQSKNPHEVNNGKSVGWTNWMQNSSCTRKLALDQLLIWVVRSGSATCAQHYWRTWQADVTKEYMILGHICCPRCTLCFDRR
jgi:hypothetical protein